MNDKIFENLRGIQRQMLKFLGEMSSMNGDPIAMQEGDDIWHPRCDVYETDTELQILIELAGVNKKDIKITTTDEYLKIQGERYAPNSAPCQVCYHNMEIETGNFERKIYFKDIPIDRENPLVSYEQGILSIKFPLLPIVEKVIHIEIE